MYYTLHGGMMALVGIARQPKRSGSRPGRNSSFLKHRRRCSPWRSKRGRRHSATDRLWQRLGYPQAAGRPGPDTGAARQPSQTALARGARPGLRRLGLVGRWRLALSELHQVAGRTWRRARQVYELTRRSLSRKAGEAHGAPGSDLTQVAISPVMVGFSRPLRARRASDFSALTEIS